MIVPKVVLIPAAGDRPYEWLGDKSLIARTVSSLEDVRGLTHIAVTVPKKQLEQAQSHVEGLETSLKIEVLVTPAPVNLLSLLHWYAKHHVQSSALLMAVNPLFPFLDRGKIESALHAVSKRHQAAATGTRSKMVLEQGKPGAVWPAWHLQEACLAVKSGVFASQPENHYQLPELKTLTLDTLEQIEVSTDTGWSVAEAVIMQGVA